MRNDIPDCQSSNRNKNMLYNRRIEMPLHLHTKDECQFVEDATTHILLLFF